MNGGEDTDTNVSTTTMIFLLLRLKQETVCNVLTFFLFLKLLVDNGGSFNLKVHQHSELYVIFCD